MTTFDEKPKAVGTSITVTVNSTTMDCSTQLIIQKKKKEPLPCAGLFSLYICLA